MLTNEKIKSNIVSVIDDYNIKKITLFGSYAKGTQNEESDIDFLVEFNEPSVSLLRISGLKLELEELLGVNVDVIHAPLPNDSFITIDKEIVLYER